MKHLVATLCGTAAKGEGFVVLALAMAGAAWLMFAVMILARLAGFEGRAIDWVILIGLTLCLLICAATLLIVDAMRAGFGALDNFFKEALARSTRPAASASRFNSAPNPADRARRRGLIGDRPYVVYGDGTVAVETLLGMRLFNSLNEAQEFIGA